MDDMTSLLSIVFVLAFSLGFVSAVVMALAVGQLVVRLLTDANRRLTAAAR